MKPPAGDRDSAFVVAVDLDHTLLHEIRECSEQGDKAENSRISVE